MRFFLLFLALASGDDEKAVPVTGFNEGDVLSDEVEIRLHRENQRTKLTMSWKIQILTSKKIQNHSETEM